MCLITEEAHLERGMSGSLSAVLTRWIDILEITEAQLENLLVTGGCSASSLERPDSEVVVERVDCASIILYVWEAVLILSTGVS